tara:strand:+ start:305 stop:1489 length:1185 start_codon:yes stop_codon:yes gene_type:complete
MKKDSYSTIIDFGSNKLRLGVFDEKLSNLFFQSKDICQKNNYEEYTNSLHFLIREAENKISTHLENITVLYDTSETLTIDLSIKKKLDQKIIFKEVCSSIILEANQLIEDCYINKKIIHAIVNKYIINDEEFLNIPKKIPEINSVIIEIKFICIPNKKYENILEIFKKNNLKIINFFLTSLVKSFKYLDLFNESNFTAFLDIGLERSTLILFINKKLHFLNSVPIGGIHVSKDISHVMKLSFDESENLKRTFNKSEIDFTYEESKDEDNVDLIKKIIEKNISISTLKQVVLARVEEIIELVFRGLSFAKNDRNREDLNLVLIGNGSLLFNKNSFQLEDKYNFKEINFYEENDIEICGAGIIFEKIYKNEDPQKYKKNQKKIGIFQKFFNLFGND